MNSDTQNEPKKRELDGLGFVIVFLGRFILVALLFVVARLSGCV
jgi:hypothetical protein